MGHLLNLLGIGLDGRHRLGHSPEGDAPVPAFEQHRHDPGAGLEPDLIQLERRGKDERGPERRVTGEGHLDGRREDPDLRVPLTLGLVDEHRLGEVHLARDRLQPVLRDLARIREDGHLIALQRRVREDIGDHVTEPRHACDSSPDSLTGSTPKEQDPLPAVDLKEV